MSVAANTKEPRPARSGTSARWGRAVLWIPLVATPLIFSTGNVDPFEFVKAAVLVVSAAAAGVVVLFSRSWSETPEQGRERTIQHRGVLAGLVLFLVSAGLSTIFGLSPLSSVRGAEGSFAGLLTLSSLVVLFVGTSRLIRNEREEHHLLAAIPWAVVGVSAYALLQLAGADPVSWTGMASFAGAPRPFSTLGHPNHMAGWLSVAAPIIALALHEALLRGWRARVAFLTVVLALACGTVVISLSRGGWAATAAGLGVFLFFLWGNSKKRRFQGHLILALSVVMGLVLSVGVFFPELRQSVVERAGKMGQLGARKEMWAAALRTFRLHPLLGCGPDNFALAFQKERTAEFRRIECDRTPARAHNDLLQLLATQGSLGLVALVVVLFGFRRGLRHMSARASPQRSGRRAAFAGVVTAFIIQGLAGFTVVSTAVLVVMVSALFLRPDLRLDFVTPAAKEGPVNECGDQGRSMLSGLATLVFGLSVASLAIFVVVRAFLADRLWRRAELFKAGSQHAVELLLQAERLDSYRDVLEVALGESARQAALASGDQAERSRLRAIAEQAFLRASRLVPESGYNWLGSARLEKDRLRDNEATPKDVERAFRAALVRDPRNAAFLTDAANAALETGNLESGVEFARRNAALYPDFGPPLGQLGLIELVKGRAADARRLFERSLSLDWCGQETARAVTLYNAAGAAVSTGDFAVAAQLARESLDIQPDSAGAHYNLARAFEGLGRVGDARREYQIIIERYPQQAVAERARRRFEELP